MEANLSPPNPTNGPTALPQCGNRDRILQIVPWEANARKGSIWMGGCRTQKQKIERLIKESQAQDADVRGHAAWALGNIGAPEVLKAI